MQHSPFQPLDYGPSVAAVTSPTRSASLGPGSPNLPAKAALSAFNPLTNLGRQVVNADAARACLAGLWLYHDYLEESHAISQELETREGSFWHAIMHRREPDAWNSKYWWRRVGSHPVLEQLVVHAPAIGYAYTTPQEFVDFCERVRGSGDPDEDLAKCVQHLEWQVLFDHCYRAAVGA